MSYISNPKTQGSGILCCIPQTGECPHRCEDCFFQSGRSYLEPLQSNLPNMPSKEITDGRVVRVNDGHDSCFNVDLVLKETLVYRDRFYNTCMPEGPEMLAWATVLTVNPGEFTDFHFYKVESPNIMFVRARANMWNLQLIENIIDFYALKRSISVIITWMNYTTPDLIPVAHRHDYAVKTHILNPYLSPTAKALRKADYLFTNPLVYECGTLCKECGNCLREYYKWKERANVK